MKYKVTALTPFLVGDGQELSPIDYMVWKDHINVLDQKRIFRLLAKGPRLEGYLAQLHKADKLDFASWGGFAQNFSERRIPFESAALTAIWTKTQADYLFIPTFAATHSGPYLPGSALKGALRTGLVFSRWSPATMEKLAAAFASDRLPRRPAEGAETAAGASQVRILAAGDSQPVARDTFKVFLTRVANLNGSSASWKVAGRGNVPHSKVDESTPLFVEMAAPGTVFSGESFERKFLEDQQFARALGWRSVPGMDLILKAANQYASAQLELHAQFAQASGFPALQQSIQRLQEQATAAQNSPTSALLNLGWGGGFLSKTSFLATEDASFRKILRGIPAFSRALREGVPFPKTRRVVFAGGQPASLPGWVRVDLAE